MGKCQQEGVLQPHTKSAALDALLFYFCRFAVNDTIFMRLNVGSGFKQEEIGNTKVVGNFKISCPVGEYNA